MLLSGRRADAPPAPARASGGGGGQRGLFDRTRCVLNRWSFAASAAAYLHEFGVRRTCGGAVRVRGRR